MPKDPKEPREFSDMSDYPQNGWGVKDCERDDEEREEPDDDGDDFEWFNEQEYD